MDSIYVECLERKGIRYCKTCGKEIDEGDISWNNGSTGYGTPCSMLEIICQRCDTELVHIDSWYPEIEDLDEFFNELDKEMEDSSNNHAGT